MATEALGTTGAIQTKPPALQPERSGGHKRISRKAVAAVAAIAVAITGGLLARNQGGGGSDTEQAPGIGAPAVGGGFNAEKWKAGDLCKINPETIASFMGTSRAAVACKPGTVDSPGKIDAATWEAGGVTLTMDLHQRQDPTLNGDWVDIHRSIVGGITNPRPGDPREVSVPGAEAAFSTGAMLIVYGKNRGVTLTSFEGNQPLANEAQLLQLGQALTAAGVVK